MSIENKVWLLGQSIIITFRYSPRLLNIIREIDGRIFNKAHKRWEIPIASIVQCVDTLDAAGFHISGEVHDVYNMHKQQQIELEKIRNSDHTPEIHTELPLYDFQKKGVKFMSSFTNPLLASDTGLGKTLQTIATIDTIKSRRNLIIAPKSLLHNWKSEILKWHPNAKVFVSDGNKYMRRQIYFAANKYPGVFYLIIGYETARIDIKELS